MKNLFFALALLSTTANAAYPVRFIQERVVSCAYIKSYGGSLPEITKDYCESNGQDIASVSLAATNLEKLGLRYFEEGDIAPAMDILELTRKLRIVEIELIEKKLNKL